jgi:phage terminase Nu1 subunit (DNA packaging protein)
VHFASSRSGLSIERVSVQVQGDAACKDIELADSVNLLRHLAAGSNLARAQRKAASARSAASARRFAVTATQRVAQRSALAPQQAPRRCARRLPNGGNYHF